MLTFWFHPLFLLVIGIRVQMVNDLAILSLATLERTWLGNGSCAFAFHTGVFLLDLELLLLAVSIVSFADMVSHTLCLRNNSAISSLESSSTGRSSSGSGVGDLSKIIRD